MEDRRDNILSGIELETDSGRTSANGLIGGVIAAIIIVLAGWLLFGF